MGDALQVEEMQKAAISLARRITAWDRQRTRRLRGPSLLAALQFHVHTIYETYIVDVTSCFDR